MCALEVPEESLMTSNGFLEHCDICDRIVRGQGQVGFKCRASALVASNVSRYRDVIVLRLLVATVVQRLDFSDFNWAILVSVQMKLSVTKAIL
jgi:hypothetical protein